MIVSASQLEKSISLLTTKLLHDPAKRVRLIAVLISSKHFVATTAIPFGDAQPLSRNR
jgi:hypothetical protein